MTKFERLEFENEINQILKKNHEDSGFHFDEPIKLKKLNVSELMYFYRLVKFKLK